MAEEAHSIAVFIDFENLALGFERDGASPAGRTRRTRSAKKDEVLDVHAILERLSEKGKVIARRAYADWGRFEKYREIMYESRHS